ncbi:hypothetical protein CL654_02680 [bacterium]|nr:hypothetical protein [bacterium]|tara:strand:- start:26885 stop:27316 length:432 start_codon:yes stop_codon:yes gene_type:complete
MSIEKFGESGEGHGDSSKEESVETDEKQTSDLEKSPQIAKTWYDLRQGFEQVGNVRKIGELLDQIHNDTFSSGTEIIEASMPLYDAFREMDEAANKREKQIKKSLAEALIREYGEEIGFKIHEDGTLELTNGLKYESDLRIDA